MSKGKRIGIRVQRLLLEMVVLLIERGHNAKKAAGDGRAD